jgi:hypothetical protein
MGGGDGGDGVEGDCGRRGRRPVKRASAIELLFADS